MPESAPEQPASRIKQAIDIAEQLFRLMRDFGLGLIFLLLVLFPGFFYSRLSSAGFTKIEKGGVTWEAQVQQANDQTKAAAATVSNASQTLQDVSSQLSTLANKTTDPQVKTAISESLKTLNGTIGDVTKADSNLKDTVLTQQDLLAQGSSSAASTTRDGWIFVGQVDEAKQKWASGSPENILPISWPVKEGDTITVSGLSYLRGDSGSGSHRAASVVSVVKDRTRLKVEQLDFSHALAGGWFVWIKGSPLS